MNIVFLSPHFPPNYYNFCVALQRVGATVLGIGDAPYNELRRELKHALTEYYRVNNMNNYDELLRTCGHFTHRYGKIDRVESHNEYWLETDSRLRTDFNIPGVKADQIKHMKRKSLMKKVFERAGANVAKGKVIRTIDEAKDFVKEVGYPVITKPDIGVGAENTYKLENEDDLKGFFRTKPPVDYFIEEFISGVIHSFDGLTDKNGNIVFYTTHVYSHGVREIVSEDMDLYYYSEREIPKELEKIGFKVVKEFDIRERFFHIEFFKTEDGRYVALELNMRPPGGLTMDMFNYANDIDMYYQWANVVVNNEFIAKYSRKYHCAYVGRKYNKNYAHTHDEIMKKYSYLVVHHTDMSPIFRDVMGNHGYLIRTPDLDELMKAVNYIIEKQ